MSEFQEPPIVKTSLSIEIEASPERVFAWLDDAQKVMQWVPNLIENQDLERTADQVGSTFRHVYLEHGHRMEMHGVVTAFVANQRLTSEISGDAFDLLVDYRLEDLGGRTRLTQDSTVSFKGLMKILGPVMTLFTRKSLMKLLQESLAKLKALAEGV